MSGYYFWPKTNDSLDCFRFYNNALNPDECGILIDHIEKSKKEAARVGGEELNKEIRDTEVVFIQYSQEFDWLFKRINDCVADCNSHIYNFDLSGIFEGIQLTKYGKGQFYKWHADNGSGNYSVRKLSVVIQLSHPEDYKGGELVFFDNGSAPKDMGTMTIFPSYMYHKVNAVKSGTRYSLVCWVSGPCFR